MKAFTPAALLKRCYRTLIRNFDGERKATTEGNLIVENPNRLRRRDTYETNLQMVRLQDGSLARAVTELGRVPA